MENRILFAPLESITGEVFRRIFHKHFKGVSEYYTPFITPKMKRGLDKKDIKEVAKENNEGIKVIPQILSNDASAFNLTAEKLLDYGYDEINLNLGCPSGTVVHKGRGAGVFKDLENLDFLLDGIFDFSEKKGFKVSIKSRIGFYAKDEFPEILAIFLKYPFYKWILHPRTGKEFYSGEVHKDSFLYALSQLSDRKNRLSFNGDLNTFEDYQKACKEFPEITDFMIGRGFLRNPFLIEDIIEQDLEDKIPSRKQRLKSFLDELFSAYQLDTKDERIAMLKLKEIWVYLGESFKDDDGFLKDIRKAKNASEYKAAVNVLFSNVDFIA